MNVLQVTPSEIYPPKNGSERRSHGLVSQFPSNGGSVVRFCQRSRGVPSLLGHEREVEIAEDYLEVQYASPVGELTRLGSAFGYPSFVFLDDGIRYRPPERLRELIGGADVVVVEEFWQVSAVADLAGPTPVVYSTQSVGTDYLEAVTGNPLGEWFLNRARRLERAAVASADAIVCEHAADERELRDALRATQPVFVVPNAVAASDVRDSTGPSEADRRVRGSRGIDPGATVGLFVGSRTDFNVDAAELLVDVAGRLEARGADVEILLVGDVGGAVPERFDSVHTPGYVEDLEAYYDAADIGLNPLTWGTTPTGSNIKMLEYLSRGLPVVSTPYGASGYDLTDGVDVVVADDEGFDDAIVELGADDARRHELSRNALAYVRENHVWETVSSRLYRRLEERLVERGGRVSVADG